jgi:hypothetical protein
VRNDNVKDRFEAFFVSERFRRLPYVKASSLGVPYAWLGPHS